jgi:hypothetical protein
LSVRSGPSSPQPLPAFLPWVYLNGAPIAISEVTELREAMIGLADFKVGAGSELENRVHLAALAGVARQSLRVRMHGSAALDLAWLAAGRLHVTVMLSNDRAPGHSGRSSGSRHMSAFVRSQPCERAARLRIRAGSACRRVRGLPRGIYDGLRMRAGRECLPCADGRIRVDRCRRA